jgi:hypothetical protein
MTLLECGIIKNQLFIFHRSLYPLNHIDEQLTVNKRSNILNMVSCMSEVVLKQQITVLENKKYRVFFYREKLEELATKITNLFVYAIGDLRSENVIVQPLLNKILLQFLERYPETNISNIESTSQYDAFSEEIDDIFADEGLTPSDRVKQYLF